jgi:WD40 repeat protein
MSSRGSAAESPVALARRVVEVVADLGASAGYRYGSGCIVRGRTVVTAAHVVAGAESVRVRDPDKRLYPARLDPRFVGSASGPGPDLALVEIEDETVDLLPLGLAQVARGTATADPVERCHAIGYPWFAERPSPETVRETVDAIGVVAVLSRLAEGLLSLQVSVSPRPLPPEETSLGASEWSGMSGAPVIADGLLLGVVAEQAPREGSSTITAVPLTALERDPYHAGWGPGVEDPAAWWRRLGVTGLNDLTPLPALAKREPPPYRETLREFGQTLHERMPQLLEREQELGEIASFATGETGYRWLVGGAFAGKSALLFEAVMAGLPAEVDADVDVVSYFLSRRASDADSNRFLAAVVPQLAYLCDRDPPSPDRDQFNLLWRQAADRAAERRRHLLLVVDGLDEDLRPANSPSVASLLPTLVGERARVLVASRPYPELPDDIPPGHPLNLTEPVPLAPFKGAKRLVELARQEFDNLMRGEDSERAVELLGVLTAAAGPLSVRDLADLSSSTAESSVTHRFEVDRLVKNRGARILEPFGSGAHTRYQFAHESFSENARENEFLADPEFRERIHRWAERWRERGWPTTTDGSATTPRYLLDTYAAALHAEPDRLAALVTDAGWVDAAIQTVGVNGVLADLRSGAVAVPTNAAVGAMLATVRAQAHHLRPSDPLAQPGYVARQLCLQASELADDRLADQLRERLQSQPGPDLVPLWTTRRVTRAFLGELGRHAGLVMVVAGLGEGRVVSGDMDGRLLLWDAARPGSEPVELGYMGDDWVVTGLGAGRVVSGAGDGRLLVWDVAGAGSEPVELGRHDGGVRWVEPLGEGRVVSGGQDGRLLVWDVAGAGSGPVELGRHDGGLRALAPLGEGRVVSAGKDGRLLVWDAARPGSEPVELGRHDVQAVVSGEGRVVGGNYSGRLLVWDAADPGSAPVVLGYLGEEWVMAALGERRVVTGDLWGRILVWDAADPGSEPVELGRQAEFVVAVAGLGEGRVVSGDMDGRLLLWDAGGAGAEAVKLGHERELRALAGLGEGRVVSGGEDGRLLLWDAAGVGSEPVELGRHAGTVRAVVTLGKGRVVSGGIDGRVLLWDLAGAGSEPVELGRHDGPVLALEPLGEGRGVVSAGRDGRLLVWDVAGAGSEPVELGRHKGKVQAMAGLGEGRVVSGGDDDRVLVWDETTANEAAQLRCSPTALTATPAGLDRTFLVIAHAGFGLSFWSLAARPLV